MASLTGLSGMGTITSERNVKDAGLFQQPLPFTDSSQQVLLDIFGASRTITIEGTYITGDAGYASVLLFITDFDKLVSGKQTSKNYTSDKDGVTYSCMVTSAERKANSGDPNSIDYTITLVEGHL